VDPDDEQYPYPGCYGYTSLALWAMDNKYGKRILVNLRGVQFDKDGEAFSQGDIAPEDEFEALEDEGTSEAATDDLGL
jgi:ssDNA-binding protein